MNLESLSELLPVLGRAHPMLLHMPIGLLIGLFLMELVSSLRKKPAAPVFLVFLAAFCAALAAASGWVLHEEPGRYSESSTLLWHERLGIATAGAAVLVFLLRAFGAVKQYRIMLFATIVVLVPTGHFGAEMTHGRGFLLEPLEQDNGPAPGPLPLAGGGSVGSGDETDELINLPNYQSHIAPLFAAKCNECHGDEKVKGGLRMDSKETLLAGGEGGPLFELDFPPEESELLYRLLLPLDDDDHMPPDHKAQPSADEIELIRAWLAAGAPFEAGFAAAAAPKPPAALEPEVSTIPEVEQESVPKDPPIEQATDTTPTELPVPPEEDSDESKPARIVIPSLRRSDEIELRPLATARLDELRDQLIHVQAIKAGSPLLWVDYAATAPKVNDQFFATSIAAVKEHVADLSLARTTITDKAISTITGLPQLTKLDLRQTQVTAIGIRQLAESTLTLDELVLSQTSLGDDAVGALAKMTSLKKLWLWKAGLSEAGLTELRAALPKAEIEAGTDDQTAALETEPDVELGKDESTVAAKPINDVCPVSDKPVDPKFTLVHDGQVIGFCCPNCPASFKADPTKYLAKLGID